MKDYVCSESTVNFRIENILCRVTFEYLTDVNQNTYLLNNEEKFLRNRNNVENTAKLKISKKQFENDGSIFITTKDLNDSSK